MPADTAVAAPATRSRRRFFNGPSKADITDALEKAKAAAASARARAREVKAEAEQNLGEARQSDLMWAVGESGAAMTGTVAGSVVFGLADYYLDEDYDTWIAAGLIGTSLAAGAASLAAGFGIHPRVGTVGLAWSTGWGAVGVSELVRRGVTMGLDAVSDAMDKAPAAAAGQ